MPTIVSRCQLVRLRPVPAEEPVSAVMDVLEEFSGEGYVENYRAANRKELSGKLNMLAGWYRDLLVFNATGDEALLLHRAMAGDIKKNARAYRIDEIMDVFQSTICTHNKGS